MRSYGATEVFPPEDADCIVDNTATGATLRANGLAVVDELMSSSTRLYANPPGARATRPGASAIEHLVLLLRSVLEARERVMVEVNVAAERLDARARGAAVHARADHLARCTATTATRSRRRCRATSCPAVIPLLKAAAAPTSWSPGSPRSCRERRPRRR